MSYHCPDCGKRTLPPAVMPNSYRHCSTCGLHFKPAEADAREQYETKIVAHWDALRTPTTPKENR